MRDLRLYNSHCYLLSLRTLKLWRFTNAAIIIQTFFLRIYMDCALYASDDAGGESMYKRFRLRSQRFRIRSGTGQDDGTGQLNILEN